MFSRKSFLQTSAMALSGTALGGSITPSMPATALSDLSLYPHGPDPVKDETYWELVRNYFPRPEGYINLENGYFSHQPVSTLQKHQELEQDINKRNSYFMRREHYTAVENARHALSGFLGVGPEELALTRNTTESLNIVIGGYRWKKGDEVIIGNQDYGSMVQAFQQASARYGIKIKTAQVPLHPKSDAEVIEAYTRHLGKKTRMVHLTHVINLTGQVIPVSAIADACRTRNVLVVVDAAHSVAQLEFKLPDLKADIVAGSLHKWMCAPLGLGFLQMKQAHIPKFWPLMADLDHPETNIRHFEHQGTKPIHSLIALGEAIRFHHQIGGTLKQNRLRYLMQYWTTRVEKFPGLSLLNPHTDNARNCAIANVRVDGYAPSDLAEKLMNEFQIFTVAIEHRVVNGVRITPHLSTSLQDLDALVSALKGICGG
ncbi:MAG: aminotransferase class V-fold PLP-dependent enzyme [Bacteroidetes bacterium]|nr:aminotransferase class V-fold PLP-dependent enzyme [Bacteroidota bacterium]